MNRARSSNETPRPTAARPPDSARARSHTAGKPPGHETFRALETKFRIVADNTYDWEFWKDPDGRFLYVSPSCKRITGHAPAEFLADPSLMLRLIHPEDRPRYQAHHQQDCRHRHASEMEFRIIRPDGAERWIGHVCGPVFGGDGGFFGTRGSNRDITDRKQTEESLRVSEEKHRVLFESSQDAIVILSPATGQFIAANSAAVKMFGVKTEAEFTSHSPWQLSPARQPDGRASAGKALEMIAIALRKGSHHFEWVHRRRNGEEFPVTVLLSRMKLGDEVLLQATVRDITERKRAEEILLKSEARFRTLLQDIPAVAVQGYGPDGTTQYWNRASEELYGYSAQEAVGRKLTDLIIPPEMRPDVEKAIAYMAKTGQAIPASELSLLRKDGARVAVFSSHAIVQVPGRPAELFCLDIDMRDLKKAEEELRRSETNLQIALDVAQLAQWHWDIPSGKLSWSPQCLALYGFPANARVTLGMFLKAIHPDDRKRVQATLRSAVKNHSQYAVEKRILRPDGSIRWTASRGRCTYDNAGRPLRMNGVSQDITERKQAQEALEKTGQQLRALAAHLQTVREEERVRLAREVHDEFGHAFTYLKLDLAWLNRRLEAKNAPGLPGVRRRISSMAKRVERDLNAVRRMVAELRPAVLDTLGLVAAIEWAAKEFEKHAQVVCKLDLASGEIEMDSSRSTALFRIFQEILTNIARHARATRVRVRMTAKAGRRLLLTVADNGCGITEQETADPTAMGLIGMRERAIELGGTMTIRGVPGEGTTITVSIPLAKATP